MLFYVRDRKNVGAKNHINALQKEKMVMNAIGNAAYSKFNLELKERMQNGSHEKNLNGSLSAALSGRDALVTPLPTENMPSNLNGKLTSEHLGLVRNSNLESLLVPPTKAQLKENSVMEMNYVGRKGDSCSSVDGSGGTSNLGHAAGNITCNNNLIVAEKQNTTAIMTPDCSMPHNSLHKKESSNVVAMPSGCNDSGKEKPFVTAEKPPSSSVFSTSSRDTCKIDGINSEMVFFLYIVCLANCTIIYTVTL